MFLTETYGVFMKHGQNINLLAYYKYVIGKEIVH